MTRARSTNIRSFSDSTWLRMTRAVVAQLVSPMTTTMTSRVARIPRNSACGPMMSRMIGARIRARTNVGRTRKKSEIRIRTLSRTPPTKPARMPTTAPIRIVISVAIRPIAIEMRGAMDGEVQHVAAQLVGAEEVLAARCVERRRRRP